MRVCERERQRERDGLRKCERHRDIESERDEGRRGFQARSWCGGWVEEF